MKPGEYTELARHYVHRAGYSLSVLRLLARHVGADADSRVADVGAGTGKLTADLLSLGFSVLCVEPNAAMLAEGVQASPSGGARWISGRAEALPLASASVDWLLMGSSFHWTDARRSLPEFHRVLQPGGHFTAIWNPRDIEGNEFHERIERGIQAMVPELKRVSSGAPKHTDGMHQALVATGHFEDVILLEGLHEVVMSRERYLGAWKSVNDIQAQAGPGRWERILRYIEEEVAAIPQIRVPYRTRAFTARRRDSMNG